MLVLEPQVGALQLAYAAVLRGKKHTAKAADAKYEIRMMRSPDYFLIYNKYAIFTLRKMLPLTREN